VGIAAGKLGEDRLFQLLADLPVLAGELDDQVVVLLAKLLEAAVQVGKLVASSLPGGMEA